VALFRLTFCVWEGSIEDKNRGEVRRHTQGLQLFDSSVKEVVGMRNNTLLCLFLSFSFSLSFAFHERVRECECPCTCVRNSKSLRGVGASHPNKKR